MTEIVTVLGKTGSKQIVIDTGEEIKHKRPRMNLVVHAFRDRMTPAPDPNDAQPEVLPPYSSPKENTLFNNLLIREHANPIVDMTTDATEV
jgi:hypothetical protein